MLFLSIVTGNSATSSAQNEIRVALSEYWSFSRRIAYYVCEAGSEFVLG